MNEYTEFKHSGPITASITLAEGSVTVTGHDADTILVEIKPASGKPGADEAVEAAVVEFEDAHLRVSAPDAGSGWIFIRRTTAVHIQVKLPHGSDVSVKSASAPITLYGDLGPVSVNSVAGSATVDKAESVRANTVSGAVVLRNVTDEAKVNTASGAVQVDYVGGDFTAKTVSGSIIADRTNASVRAHTVSGLVQLSSLRRGTCRANSVSGHISLGIVPGTDVWMDLDAKVGTVTSELAAGDTSSVPHEKGDALELHARSLSGNIDLHRSTRVLDTEVVEAPNVVTQHCQVTA
ncbi:DUF4097 family beta strand repeat-containing protein [Natronoglycomyces albus]|uniref:DUF4097 family beta strand repeat protein n=1 Tax=Natronoglycomyces albus TaxID=2811108 RepID=A0A895XG52_9ACTN|nr:DUF4097 family beta strand repeat-containing protein [Natronoglycomyces albus]QSB04314.1 DUF4097 family beta strand repeat protein [Natronoglycomyces albus]